MNPGTTTLSHATSQWACNLKRSPKQPKKWNLCHSLRQGYADSIFFYHGLLLVDFKEPSINIKYSLYKDRLDKLHKAIKNARTGMISHGLSVAWQCSFTYYEHFAGSGSENMGNSHIPSLQPQSVTKYLSFVHTLTESFKETAILLWCRHRDYGG